MDTLTLPAQGVPVLPPVRILRSVVGFSLLGLFAAIGSHEGQLVDGLQAALLPVAGATVLTVPALLVAHQTLALKADPQSLLRALGRTLCDAGELALALLPVLGLFLLTTDITPALFFVLQSGIGVLTLLLGVLRLFRAEHEQNPGAALPILLLALGWATLAGLIGLRLFVSPLLTLF